MAIRADPVAAIDRLLRRDRNWWPTVAAVFALQLSLILSHIAWLDEWQALQIAAGSTNTATLFANLRYEGHPPLWYWYLQAVSAAVPFAYVLKAAVLPFAGAAQALILFKSPFSRGERVLIATGALMMFEYLTLSRSMAMGVAGLVFLLAFWHRQRAPWVAIAVLPMCDFLFGVLSIFAVAGRWREQRFWVPGLALWVVSGLFAAWSVRPAPDMTSALAIIGPAESLYFVLQNLGTALVPWQAVGWTPQWNTALPFHLGLFVCPLFLAFGHFQTRADRPSLIAFWAFAALLLGFSVAVYSLQFRHVSLIALLLILLRWRLALAGLCPDRWFRLWLLVGAICGIATTSYALRTPFDRAPEVAEWIKREGLAKENWITFQESEAQAVSALSGVHFERLDQGCRQTFVRWNQPSPIERPSEFDAALDRFVAEHGRGYLLTDMSFLGISRRDIHPLAHFGGGHNGQNYYLWVIRPDLPVRGSRSRYCTPSMRGGNGRPAINNPSGPPAAPKP